MSTVNNINRKTDGRRADRNTKEVKVWARTQSQAINFKFEWVIENFSLKPQKIGECIISPTLSDKTQESRTWYMAIYPGGWKEKDCISLFLYLKKQTACPSLIARYKITLLNSKQKTLAVYGPHLQTFCSENNFAAGESKFIKLLDLYKRENNFLPDDELFISCEISYETNGYTTTGYSLPYLPLIPSQSGSIVDHFQQLLCNKSVSDVIIDVQGQKFEAHKLILSTRSPVFYAMFQSDLIEKKTNTLEIREIEPDVFSEVLRFIYTDKVEKLDELASALMVAADKYMLDLLKTMCEESLARNVTLDNCCELLILAHLHSAQGLLKVLLDFVCSHSFQVAATPNWQKFLNSAHPQLLRDISMTVMTRPSASQ